MAFDIQALVEASRCGECANEEQKKNVALYLLNQLVEAGGGGSVLHNLLSLTHPDTVPGPPLRGSLVVGNVTPDWEALLIGPANRVLRSDGTDVLWAQVALTTDVTGVLPPANGGTGTSTALTAGSVVFAGAAGAYTEDNANLFYDDTNNFLGIGTNSPAVALDVALGLATRATTNAVIAADQNDYAIGSGTYFRLATDAGRTITGITGGVNGKHIWIANVGAFNIGFSNQSVSSAASNRIITGLGAGFILSPDQVVEMIYDSTVLRWRAMPKNVSLTAQVTGVLPIANGGTNSSAALNNNRIMVSSGGAIVEAAALTNGQLLIGSTGAAPVAAGLTAGANITITPGVGSITIAATGVVTQAYSTIQEEGVGLPQQSTLNFISAALTAADDPGNSRTNVTLTHAALTRVDDTNVTLTLGGSPTTALLAATSLTLGWTGVLSVARGGSGTGTAFTQGSVIFAGVAGVFAQDNANFFWDDTNNRLGLGTATPNQQLELTGNLRLVATTATAGIVYQGASTFIHTFGTANLFVGVGAGNLTLSGTGGNTGIGQSALMSLTTGEFNFGCGFGSLTFCTTGIRNTGIGSNSLRLTITASSNVAIGYSALQNNLAGDANTAVGTSSLQFVIGLYNVGVGFGTLSTATSADSNIAIGTLAGANITTGDQNIVIGHFTDSPTATNSFTMTIGNLLFGTGVDGTGTTLSSGNIGVGVITPLAKFHVTNSAAATVGCIIKAAAAQSANIMEWQSSAAAVFVCVDEVGNFGIGIASPIGKLHLNDSDGALELVMSDTSNAVDARNWIWQTGTGIGAGVLRLRAANDANSAGINAMVFTRTGISAISTDFPGGNVGIGTASPTARLHLAAGTATASTAPLKFTTGTSLTVAEAGVMEFTTDDLFFTITTGAARKRLLMADATAGLTSGKIPIATTNGRLTDLTASAAYTPTNVTTDRSYDANATTLDELSDVVGTMIADLQANGILG